MGRLYPNPATPDLFILDFLYNNGTRVLSDTGRTIYDVGYVGFMERTVIQRATEDAVGQLISSC